MSIWRCGEIARACSPCPVDPKPSIQRQETPQWQQQQRQAQQAQVSQQHLQQQRLQQQQLQQQQLQHQQLQQQHLQGQEHPGFPQQYGAVIAHAAPQHVEDLRSVAKPQLAEDIKPAAPEFDQPRTGGLDIVNPAVVEASGINVWEARQAPENKPPVVSEGFKEALAGPAPVPMQTQQEENEPEPEEQKAEIDTVREVWKSRAACGFVIAFWLVIFISLSVASQSYEEPFCHPDDEPDICEVCGRGTLFLPLFGDYERAWPDALKVILYFVGLLWCFLGIAIVCDQFMAAIEEITSQTRVVWLEVHGGARHKFHLQVWNGTVANLTLMALGSSAPEIMLSVIELMGNSFFAGELGPSTIVGSAAFNLLVITAVCVSALPAGKTKKIEMTGVFAITASFSIFAYLWLLVILVFISPNKVDVAEGLLTFLFFPVLVVLAFMADKGWIMKCGKSEPDVAIDDVAAEKSKLEAKYGKSISIEMAKIVLQSEMKADGGANDVSRAARRRDAMSVFTGSSKKKTDMNDLVFGFRESHFVCLECAGTLKVPVVANRPPGVKCQVRYVTRDGTAQAGLRYVHTEGLITFEPHQTEYVIEVPIIDNDVYEHEEGVFTIELHDLVVNGSPGPPPGARPTIFSAPEVQSRMDIRTAQVSILNDDLPGMLSFAADEVKAKRGSLVTLGINRTEGSIGEITCHYEAQDMTAKVGRDFQNTSGVISMAEGQVFDKIVVPIKPGSGEERTLRVVLSNPSPGVKFDPNRDGGDGQAVCEIIIEGDNDGTWRHRLSKKCCSPDKCAASFGEWAEQMVAAVYCNGSIEDQAEANSSDWFFHVLSLPWKVFFSLVPPPSFLGGWLCFTIALSMIGTVTALVGDMAGLLGCSMGLPADITAITLVALGTSLPDTFASKAAAQQDESADNSVGNVTGSNSVNVFLGLGMPWTIGAFYWSSAGVTAEWLEKKVPCEGACDTYETRFLADYPEGGFMVPADSLGSSVAVFSACAITCLAMLVIRRKLYGGELGGPRNAAMRDATIFVCLWFVYILFSIIQSLSG